MQITISASGTPHECNTQVAKQLKRVQKDNAEAWPALSTIRDYIGKRVAQYPADASLSISATASVNVTVNASIVERKVSDDTASSKTKTK